ncbi:MAG: hypothetical protein K2Q18_02395 [Bdellovibrionales bacterium]|nr:hypothetical protein [Bdellovibrionales bacterium]
MKSMQLLIFLCVTVFCGCSTVGPVVTNISPDGNGSVQIDKCNIHTNFFWGFQTLKDCRTQTINMK